VRSATPASLPATPASLPASQASVRVEAGAAAKTSLGRLVDALERCDRVAVGVRTACSLDLDEGTDDYKECVKRCTTARNDRDARIELRAADARRQSYPPSMGELEVVPPRRGTTRATTLAMADALTKCVAGVVETSQDAICLAPEANELQQMQCDRSCAEQASTEIRRLVGPPH
jgi:hypothetical protein